MPNRNICPFRSCMLLIALLTGCTDCLANNVNQIITHVWCVSTQACIAADDVSTCQNYEAHDLLFEGDRCCSDITDEDTCLDQPTISYCLFCPSQQQCMYSSRQFGTFDNINNNCDSAPDISSKCSLYPNCSSCAEDVVCAFCPEQGQCLTKILEQMDYPLPQYKCIGGKTTICCDSYMDCETCGLYTEQIIAPICAWCDGPNEQGGIGYCDTVDKLSECEGGINTLGISYCNDQCYMKGKDCSSCVRITGCVWLNEIVLDQLDGGPKSLCTRGGASGPKSTEIVFLTTGPINYKFDVISYNYLTCALTAYQLNALIISLAVIIVVGIISGYVGSYFYKKIRYQKLLKQAKLAALTDKDKLLVDDEKAFDNQDYMVTMQEIPWED